MAHPAYFVAGEKEAGMAVARRYVESELGLGGASNPDIVFLDFGLFSVEDARKLIDTANLSATGLQKAIVASMTRIFHEAQNALLKVLEEPPEGVTIILCVPSEGMFIPTLRSRLLALAQIEGNESQKKNAKDTTQGIAAQFLASTPDEREKLTAKLVERSKADKDEVKQEARREAIELLQGITEAAYGRLHEAKDEKERVNLRLLLEELTSFMPILYERSAPLKLIFEHLLLVIPKTLAKAKV